MCVPSTSPLLCAGERDYLPELAACALLPSNGSNALHSVLLQLLSQASLTPTLTWAAAQPEGAPGQSILLPARVAVSLDSPFISPTQVSALLVS